MHKYFFKLFFVSLFLLGCSVQIDPPRKSKVLALTQLLESMDSVSSHQEAEQLSKDIFQKTARLTKEFKMISPPQYHNFLVNIGLKEKGLCYHWSDTLYIYFTHKSYPSFTFHLMGANIGEYWTEHNAMVVVAKDLPVEQGIVVDPWRDPGKLYFSKVREDTQYHWKHRPKREYQKGK